MFLKYATAALATMAISVHAYPNSFSGDVSAAVAGASFGKYNRDPIPGPIHNRKEVSKKPLSIPQSNEFFFSSLGNMGVSHYEATSSSKCVLAWDNLPADGFVDGVKYSMTLTTDVEGGLGMVWKAGAEAQANSGDARKTSQAVTWTATGTSVSVSAICGAGGTYDKVHVAAKLVGCAVGHFIGNAGTCTACTAVANSVGTVTCTSASDSAATTCATGYYLAAGAVCTKDISASGKL